MMHQPFEDDQAYQRARKEHLKKLSELWDAVMEGSLSDEEARQRLEALKFEQAKLENYRQSALRAVRHPSFNEQVRHFNEADLRTELFGANPRAGQHAMDFKCQCKRCVRLHTITMDDVKWLKKMGIVWKGRNKRGRKVHSD